MFTDVRHQARQFRADISLLPATLTNALVEIS